MSSPDASPIPDDFPRFTGTGALAGAQPKLALRQVEGRFTSLGPDSKTLVQLHARCESLARQIAGSGKQLVELGAADAQSVMKSVLRELREKEYCPEECNAWIIRRVEQLNGWPTFAFDPPGTFWVELTPEQVYALNPVTVVRPVFTRVEQLKYGLRKPGQPPL